ncbi:MAG: hypothetical protein HUU20_12080 [Pirellulales bacterium]|nr:hypothetical protein [Pirellulales bacterium]
MAEIQRRTFLGMIGAGAALRTAVGQSPRARAGDPPAATATATPTPSAEVRTFVSGREDGRFVETAAFLHKFLQKMRPRLEFHSDIPREAFPAWQKSVREKLLELMCFPETPSQPAPKRIASEPREGYRLERWEMYPEPHSVVPFFLLVPHGASPQSPSPAVLCFPGSTGSKENLAGEPERPGASIPADPKWLDNRMAWHYARRGFVAMAVDSPATNELAAPLRERNSMSLAAIWMGRSYEAVTVFQKARLLQWLVEQPFVDPKRIATSGHSLGAKPADILGVLYPDLVGAVVHNDFVCNWQERAVAENLDVPGAHQIVPGIFQWFDYTDLEASLAPRPLLFTEGGRAKQIAKIRRAYELHGAAEAMALYYYETYDDPASRPLDTAELPVGITAEQYFQYAYVTPALHRFRPDRAVPWLAKVFGI